MFVGEVGMTESWPIVTLGDVLTQYKSYIGTPEARMYPKLSVKLYGKGVVLDTAVDGSSVKMKSHQIAKAGQVILSEIWGKRGAIGLVPPDGEGALCTSHFFLFDVDQKKIDLGYLQALLKTNYLENQLNPSAKGTTGYAAIRPSHLLSAKIPLPPIEGQRRIAALLAEVTSRTEEAQMMREQAERETDVLVDATILKIFSERHTTSWTGGRLEDYLIDIRYGTSRRCIDDSSGTPVLRMGNIQNGRLDLRWLKYLHLDHNERRSLLLLKGDILVNRTNSADLVGKCAVFDLDDDFSFASYLIRIRLDTTLVEPRLVAAYINSPIGRQYMLSKRKQMTGQANVNASRLKALPIALPPLEEQVRIVKHIEQLRSKTEMLRELQVQTSRGFESLLPSIMNKALREH